MDINPDMKTDPKPRTNINLVIGVPTSGHVRIEFAYAFAGLVASLASGRVSGLPDVDIEAHLDISVGTNWIENRENIVQRALDRGATHLLFLDDDMSFDHRILAVMLRHMLAHQAPIVLTNYLQKTEPPVWVAVSMDDARIATTESSTGLEPIAYSGFGVSLFDCAVFCAIEPPRFLPEYIPGRGITTEDLGFFRKVWAAGFPVLLDHEASKLIQGHHGVRAWNWKEGQA